MLLAPEARERKRRRDARYRARRRARQHALNELAARLALTSAQQRSWLAEIVADEQRSGRVRLVADGAEYELVPEAFDADVLDALRSLTLATPDRSEPAGPRSRRRRQPMRTAEAVAPLLPGKVLAPMPTPTSARA